ncbi:MAG: peptide chain release factor N(5)-glutamine methyltransferase [Synergistaceae bacterium]|jgi:release factor glutamine methyltransferase|nr:peptide chain release factor N(5)-glutamine methyltransferase [Synergistaceae bacterium]
MTRVADVRAELSKRFEAAGVPMPFLEADRIIGGILGVSRASLYAHPERGISFPIESRIRESASRRISGEPLSYILGDAIFLGRRFIVGGSVLIPRTETEILAEIASGLLTKDGAVFADWCTGSGCIAVTLLAERPSSRGYAADVSAGALDTARRSAALHGVESRIEFIQCEDPDGAEGIIPRDSLDLVVMNPPYIPSETIKTLEVQVRDYEPRLALDGGPDGLDVFRKLLPGIPGLMKPGAPLAAETGGGGQLRELRALAERTAPDLEFVNILPDHRSIDRFMLWRKRV